MRLVRHLSDLPFDLLEGGSVATIGAYDGIHQGHTQLLDRVIGTSRQRNLPSVVMSFEPMPREFFAAGNPPARLMRFREKFDALASYGVDIFYCPQFGMQMREIDVGAFIRRILIHGLNISHLVVGDDFKFARRREGSFDHLKRAGAALNYTVERVSSIIVNDERVSSTAIRQALWNGEMQRATSLLGRPYRMSGKVVVGKKVGRTLGFPTANVDIRRRQSAVMGIFAVRVSGFPGGQKDAVASVGTRPTFDGTKPLLEVHIFDFDELIYGDYIHVDFMARLRSEKKFAAIDELVAQMHRDADNARSILSELNI